MDLALYPIAVLILVASWIISEFKLARSHRLVLGTASFIAVGLLFYSIGTIRIGSEISFHRFCFQRINELTQQGDISRVQEAFRVYNSAIASRQGTSKAAQDTYAVLRGGESRPQQP